MDAVRTQIARLWRASAPLTVAGVIMLLPLVALLAAMATNRPTILGAPAWLKPAKFDVSSAIYCTTIAGWSTAVDKCMPCRISRG